MIMINEEMSRSYTRDQYRKWMVLKMEFKLIFGRFITGVDYGAQFSIKTFDYGLFRNPIEGGG